MGVLVDREIILARLRLSKEIEKRVRARFYKAYGEVEGEIMMKATLERLTANLESDSAEITEQEIQNVKD